MAKRTKIILGLASILGVAMGALAVYAAWMHNPQGEFCIDMNQENCRPNLTLLGSIGLSWFVPYFIGASVAGFVVVKIVDLIRKR